MKVSNDISVSSDFLSIKASVSSSPEKNSEFSSILGNQTEKETVKSFMRQNETAKSLQELIEIFREKGFKGLFMAIEEEKIKKLREEILREMGLTQEKLAELPPEQRAEIEKTVSEEIQRRMALGSLENNESRESLLNKNQENTAQMFLNSGLVDPGSGKSAPFINLIPLINLADKDEN
ncbi:MAG: hypothetical protein AB7E04_12770 [Desulfobacteraceae bacterium]